MVMATRVYIVLVCPRLALPWRPGHFSLSLSFYDRLSFVDGGIILTADAAQIKRLLTMTYAAWCDGFYIIATMRKGQVTQPVQE